MKISVIGPGALGCFLGAALARAGHEVWLVDHLPDRARRIEAQGITLYDRDDNAIVVRIKATVDPAQAAPAQIALLCVKSASAVRAARAAQAALGPDGVLIAMQNGIAHHGHLAGLSVSWALGVTAQGAHLLGEGVVKHGGVGPTSMGFLSSAETEAQARLSQAAALLSQAGIPACVVDDILAVAWNKLIINAGINALTVLEDCTNGELLHRPHVLNILKAAVHEAAQVASASGIRVCENPEEKVLDVCRNTAANVSSMLQDTRAGRNTEIDAINGEIVRLAKKYDIPAPTNQYLVNAVKRREAVR